MTENIVEHVDDISLPEEPVNEKTAYSEGEGKGEVEVEGRKEANERMEVENTPTNLDRVMQELRGKNFQLVLVTDILLDHSI